MSKRCNKRGFTMAELLIVVAIIAVLVAVAIPVFNNQLEKSRESVDISTIRNYYAKAVLVAMESNGVDGYEVIEGDTRYSYSVGGSNDVYRVRVDNVGAPNEILTSLHQKEADWQTDVSSIAIDGISAEDWVDGDFWEAIVENGILDIGFDFVGDHLYAIAVSG